MMFFSALSAFCALSLVNAAAMDVYAPPITSPSTGTIWVVGKNVTVTWDTTNPPKQITNPNGEIRLRKGGRTSETALASGFNILDGNVTVIVPTVTSGIDYQVVLFGDSGNFSPEFAIADTLA